MIDICIDLYVIMTDIHFGSWKQMNPLSKNIFQNIKKIGTKISHTHPDILCSYTNFLEKGTFFVSHIKKTNLCMNIWLFTGRIFVFFTDAIWNVLFVKNLCTNIECPYLHAIFFEIFWHFKIYFLCIFYNRLDLRAKTPPPWSWYNFL
jgi:hypothetical protein